jgi:hypothetical protein
MSDRRIGMSRRISLEIGAESYLDLLARGKRNDYIRKSLDKRLSGLRSALRSLRDNQHDDIDIIMLLGDASQPVARIDDTRLADMESCDVVSVRVLWAEMVATGLSAKALLEALDTGRDV